MHQDVPHEMHFTALPAGSRKAFPPTTAAHLLIQSVHPQHRIHRCQRSIPKLFCLVIQALGHLAHLAAGDAFNTQAFRKFLHLTSGYTLYEGFLHHLDQCRFAALALCYKEGDVAAIPYLGNQQVHGAQSGVQSPRPEATTVAGSILALLVLLCPELVGTSASII